MKKKLTILMVTMALVVGLCGDLFATDMSYLYDYKWQLNRKWHTTDNSKIWNYSGEIRFSSDGKIYNNNDRIVGYWSQSPYTDYFFISVDEGGANEIYGDIQFLPSPTTMMDGSGYGVFFGSWRSAKIVIVRSDPIS